MCKTSETNRALDVIAHGGLAILAEGSGPDALLGLCAPADEIRDGIITRMAVDGRGLICLAIDPQQAQRLGLHAMVEGRANPSCAGYARSIEAATGVSTGISAADRARTMSVAADPNSGPWSLVSPGHVFPVVTHERGLIGRFRLAEAAVDLMCMADREPAAAYCRILRDDGEAATRSDLPHLPWAADLPMVDMGVLLAERCARDLVLERAANACPFVGSDDVRMICYNEPGSGRQHWLIGRPGPRSRTHIEVHDRSGMNDLDIVLNFLGRASRVIARLHVDAHGHVGASREIFAAAVASAVASDLASRGWPAPATSGIGRRHAGAGCDIPMHIKQASLAYARQFADQ